MSTASAMALAKSNLVTALTSLWAGTGVLVTYGVAVDEPEDIVQILDMTVDATEDAPLSPLRHRDYLFTLTGLIDCSRGGGPEIQQTVTERALTLLGNIDDYLRDSGASPSTHVTLGDAVRFARITSWELAESDGESDDEDITNGRTTVIAFTVGGKLRA